MAQADLTRAQSAVVTTEGRPFSENPSNSDVMHVAHLTQQRGGFLSICRQAFILTALFSLAVGAMAFASPLYSMQIYDRILSSRSEATLIWITAIVAFLLGTMAVLDAVRGRVMQRAAGRLEYEVAPALLSISFDRALKLTPAKGAHVLREFDALKSFLGSQQSLAFFDAPMAPLFIAAIWLLHPLLGVVATLGAAVLLLVAWLNERFSRPILEEAQDRTVASSTLLDDSLRNSEALHAMGMFGPFAGRLLALRGHSIAANMRAGDLAGTFMGMTKFVRLMLQVALLGAGAWLAMEQELTAGAIIAISILSQRGLQPIEQIIGAWKRFREARRAYGNLCEALREISPASERVELPAPEGNLAAEGLVVCPPGSNAQVVKGIDLRVPAGTAAAIVGPSGSGKSSLLRALVGAWPVKAGVVRLDGADIHEWDRANLGPYVGYLPQGVELFPGTIGENIARFGKLDSAAIVEAAKRANVHELILSLPDGYDTKIGPGAHALSAGQRQMVGLARALYREPKLLILDEPNAHLDEAGEQSLCEAIREAKQRGATVIVVSHRSGILSAIDAIVFLEGGRVTSVRKRQPSPAIATEDGMSATQEASAGATDGDQEGEDAAAAKARGEEGRPVILRAPDGSVRVVRSGTASGLTLVRGAGNGGKPAAAPTRS